MQGGKMGTQIDQFTGDYGFLSNFFRADFYWSFKKWSTVEHAYQATKCCNPEDEQRIIEAKSPAEAIQIGRTVELQPNWNWMKEGLMEELVRQKFRQNPMLSRLLVDTGSLTLVEGNSWHDNTWGDCRCHQCRNIVGKNLLGKILMKIRQEFLEDPEYAVPPQ